MEPFLHFGRRPYLSLQWPQEAPWYPCCWSHQCCPCLRSHLHHSISRLSTQGSFYSIDALALGILAETSIVGPLKIVQWPSDAGKEKV